MSPPVLTMSNPEFERAVLLRKVHDKRLTQAKAAEILGLSLRQVERLCRRYRVAGPASLASKRRGRASNHQLAPELRESVLGLVRTRYADFGPTLALEKLVECHGLAVSKETLRKWMTEDGLWVPHARRRDRIHQPRHRRSCIGELIQIDGCDHEWFEERAPRCTPSIAAANAFALEFIADFNTRFAKAPRNAFDAHRPVLTTENLDDIFTWQETRKVSQSLTFNYQRQLFLLQDTQETRPLAGKQVIVHELSDGKVEVRHDGKVLEMKSFAKQEAQITQGAVVSNKLLSCILGHIKDKQATKDAEGLKKARTKRDKRLLLQRIKATG